MNDGGEMDNHIQRRTVLRVFRALGAGLAMAPLAAVAATFLMFTLVSGPALAQERFEIKSLRTPIPHIEATLAAIKQRDVAKAIDAFEAYDSAWNGVEVYVNVRSRPTYELLEINLQNKITKALTGPNPDFAALTADTESLLAEYKKAVDAFAKLPALNSLYDDVTRLRVVRAHLREVTPAIKAGKLAKARKSFEEFADNWDSIEDLIKQRSGEAYVAIEKGMIDIENAWSALSLGGRVDVDAEDLFVEGGRALERDQFLRAAVPGIAIPDHPDEQDQREGKGQVLEMEVALDPVAQHG